MAEFAQVVTTTPGQSPRAPATRAIREPEEERLWAAAQSLEASFLAEMLKNAGFGAAREGFGGGSGEEQFTSFLRERQAEDMVRHGGIGLAESLFEALKERADAAQ
ncbi:rod-binding protein [Ostreiculturibacter nitratireducens]|uniref:rod-binding protein n=1 Tax=Ostreiculturibacter nitratireducens TaxID=3075226 RepID=UPI0031B640B4